MVNKVTIPNDSELIIVSIGEDGDEIQFASDLKSNLKNFKLVNINTEQECITFSSDNIDFSSKTYEEKLCSYRINFGCKVLIRNKRIVLTDCTPLLSHKVLILK